MKEREPYLASVAFEVTNAERSDELLMQLKLELAADHILQSFRDHLDVLAETGRPDDVIVATGSEDTPFALVHMTWCKGQEPYSDHPTVELFADKDELREGLLIWFEADDYFEADDD